MLPRWKEAKKPMRKPLIKKYSSTAWLGIGQVPGLKWLPVHKIKDYFHEKQSKQMQKAYYKLLYATSDFMLYEQSIHFHAWILSHTRAHWNTSLALSSKN